MNEYKVTARKSGGAIIGTLIRGDNGTAAVRVVIPRYANGVDLAPLVWSTHVANASGATDVVIPTAVTADDASVMFEWLPGGVATAAAGMTEVHFEGVDEGALVWASSTYHLRIDDKNDAPPSGEDAQKLTELQQLIVFVSGELNGVIEAGRAAQEAANRANEAAERAESIAGVAIDETLTQPGAAADAAVVGEKIDELSEEKADKKDIPAPYTLPVASAETLGGVKVGEGLRMDGDVMNVGEKYEHVETIVCDGTYGPVLLSGLAFRRMKIDLHMAAATAAATVVVQADNGAGMFGYAWVSNGINTEERWATIDLCSDGEEAYCEYTAPASAAYKAGALYKTASKLDASTPINRINIYVSGSGVFPEGSIIDISGVRS